MTEKEAMIYKDISYKAFHCIGKLESANTDIREGKIVSGILYLREAGKLFNTDLKENKTHEYALDIRYLNIKFNGTDSFDKEVTHPKHEDSILSKFRHKECDIYDVVLDIADMIDMLYRIATNSMNICDRWMIDNNMNDKRINR